MVHLLPNPLRVPPHLRSEPPRTAAPARANWRNGGTRGRSTAAVRCSMDYLSPIAAEAAAEDLIGISKESGIEIGSGSEYLAKEFGWKVRKLIEEEDDLRMVAKIQAEAFHEPAPFFNHFFYHFFQAEVLSALIYRLKNYPPDRYACLVAEAESESCEYNNIVGVVDVTVAGDLKVRRLLPAGQKEYLFVTGIAVSLTARRRKVATALLKGCDMLGKIWGLKYLALSVYEDDYVARNLYSKAGYEVLSIDPLWKSSWIGRKRCVTMPNKFIRKEMQFEDGKKMKKKIKKNGNIIPWEEKKELVDKEEIQHHKHLDQLRNWIKMVDSMNDEKLKEYLHERPQDLKTHKIPKCSLRRNGQKVENAKYWDSCGIMASVWKFHKQDNDQQLS